MNEDLHHAALLRLGRYVVTDLDLEATLQDVAELTRNAIPAVDIVGYSLLDADDNPSTPIYTDEKSPRIDQGQYEDNRGPCLDAGRLKTIVRVDNVADFEHVYPTFAKIAQESGIQSTLSLPLAINDKGVGAMNLYAPQPNAFSTEDEAKGAELADAISVVVTNAMAYWHARSLADHLNEAMKSRAIIEQAKGILMAQQRGMTADQAFDLLVSSSQKGNVKLRDIAQTIVDRSSGKS